MNAFLAVVQEKINVAVSNTVWSDHRCREIFFDARSWFFFFLDSLLPNFRENRQLNQSFFAFDRLGNWFWKLWAHTWLMTRGCWHLQEIGRSIKWDTWNCFTTIRYPFSYFTPSLAFLIDLSWFSVMDCMIPNSTDGNCFYLIQTLQDLQSARYTVFPVHTPQHRIMAVREHWSTCTCI